MVYRMKFKSLFLFLTVGSTILFAAGNSEKKFDVESGMIVFSISGAGQLSHDINLTIWGDGKLRFRDWGVEAMVEEEYEVIAIGALQYIHKVQLCEKFEDKQRFDVDFEVGKIFERPMPKGNFKEYYVKGMEKKGQETIAGQVCDVWEGEGVKKCLYKGIPLLVEHYFLGVYYQKKAVEIKLNIKSDPSKCALPDFPVEKFALFKTNIKTKNIKVPVEFSEMIRTIRKNMHKYLNTQYIAEDELNEKQKTVLLDKMGENIFEAQKKFLPEYLETFKKARVCLQQAENEKEANICLSGVIAMKKSISKNMDNSIESWDEKEKSKTLDAFDDNIFLLESKMKCIRASQKLSDLAACMK